MNTESNSIKTSDRQLLRYAPLMVLAVIMAVAIAALFVQGAGATPGSGVTPTAISSGTLVEPVRLKLKDDGGFGSGTQVTSITTVRYDVAPGGYFGWHVHGGPVWAVVVEGTLTLYEGDAASCQGRPIPAGSGFLDPGDHVHNARNEGTTPVVVYATFMMPEGAALRIDAANPGGCPF